MSNINNDKCQIEKNNIKTYYRKNAINVKDLYNNNFLI